MYCPEMKGYIDPDKTEKKDKMYNEYLEKTEYVDYDDPAVKSLAERLEAWKRGVTEISLDATEEGRPLYERLGFTESTEGMVLVNK